MKESKTYAYISIVAIVAIVALFVMNSGNETKEIYPPTFNLEEADLIGDARHIVSRGTETTNIDRLAAEPVIKTKKSDFALVDISRIPKLRNGCTPLSQSWFNTLTSDSLIMMGQGCVTLIENVTTNYSLAIQGNLEFFGEGYQIAMIPPSKTVLIGFDNSVFYNTIVTQVEEQPFGAPLSVGFKIYDYSQIHNSMTKDMRRGFELNDYASAHNTTARSVSHSGFKLRDNSLLKDSVVRGPTYGITLSDHSIVENSVVTNTIHGFTSTGGSFLKAINCLSANNSHGFWFHGGEIINSTAEDNNNVGFRLGSGSKVYGSTAANNNVGFFLEGNIHNPPQFSPEVHDSTATYNVIGFDLKGNSQLHESTATNNQKGFLVRENSHVYESISTNNYIGFELKENSNVYESTATNNEKGFLMFESSSAVQSIAVNNADGFELRDASSIYEAMAANNSIGVRSEGDILSEDNPIITGGHFCDNINRNLVVNGGILSGTITTSPTSGFGAYNGNPTLIACDGPTALSSRRAR